MRSMTDDMATDMQRATVHDGSSQAWGLNDRNAERMGIP